ncbi:DRTGG domain-containing protein [Acholeplasma vituli]|uniref:DRTGG domain-containing protein n=1 Tax=Paracholeplasma vituli TaxID=69473 RepID=A0ABT2PUQ5_9MOLU|nr:DRTGG domain-containing protein [Paracholeplasma vituli]MCU0104685.1 DRTGG domain-containing protein [Paracholeplasma vituli]
MAYLSTLLHNEQYQRLTGTEDSSFKGVFATDLLSTAIKHMRPDHILITLICSQSTLNVMSMLDLQIVILTQDALLTDAFIEKAKEAQITVIKTTYLTHEVIQDLVLRGLL